MGSEISLSPPSAALWRRPRVWVIGIALLALLGVMVHRSITFVKAPPVRRGRFQDGGNQPVGAARVRHGDIRITIRALGAVTPLQTVTVTPQISGFLTTVAFKEGQTVRKGQFLAQIDPRPYETALQQDQAQLARDDATLKQAQMYLQRYQTLAQQNSIARQTAEDQVWIVEESALIGVAIGAYFPTVSLSSLGGYAGSQLSRLINLGNRIWSIGASASDTLYDFGARAGAVTSARANYDQYVAVYRQTAADIALNQYNAGTVAYTTVITALQTLITAQQTALTLRQNRLVASVTLIEALGGGWTTASL